VFNIKNKKTPDRESSFVSEIKIYLFFFFATFFFEDFLAAFFAAFFAFFFAIIFLRLIINFAVSDLTKLLKNF
jgi:hypothetical protein